MTSHTVLNRLPVSSSRALRNDTSPQTQDAMPVLRPPLGTVMTHAGMPEGQKLGGCSNSWRYSLLALPGVLINLHYAVQRLPPYL